MKASLAFIALSFVPHALGHGFVSRITIAGKSYKGNMPMNGGGPSDEPSVIRQIENTEPIQPATNKDVNCGRSSQTASLVADAMPGDSVDFAWDAGDGSHWPHDSGPLLTYMASCGSQPCSQYASADAKWFKIDQVGKRANGKWAQVELFEGKVHTVTIPPTLAPGNYLIRHEIIALHLGEQKNGAEFYPSCAQLRVGGTQTGAPSASELVSLPGAYSSDDPGIFYNVYDPNAAPYNPPGPPVSKIAAVSNNDPSNAPGGSTGTSPATSPGVAGTSPAGPSFTSSPSSPKKGTCRLKKKTASPASLTKRQSLKQHLSLHSRIIAKLFH